MISITDIQKNPYQPRKEFDGEKLDELAQSIKEKWGHSTDYCSFNLLLLVMKSLQERRRYRDFSVSWSKV